MTEKKNRRKKILAAGFNIVWATNPSINENTQNILNSLTNLSLANAYYSLFQPDHCGC